MENLLILHGAIGSSEQLIPLKENLKDKYHIHLLNFPGHGGVPATENFSIQYFSTYVKNYLLKNNLTQVYIFGYSMGGYVALYLAKQHPHLIKKIITLATKFDWDEETSTKEIKMLQPEVIEEKIPKFAAILQHRHQPNNWKEILKNTADMLVEMGKNNPLTHEDYMQIQTSTLIILGDRDKMVSMEETTKVYKNLPAAQLCVLPKTPHPIEQVDMKSLCCLIEKFLEEKE